MSRPCARVPGGVEPSSYEEAKHCVAMPDKCQWWIGPGVCCGKEARRS